MAAAAARDGVVVAGLGADVEEPGKSAALVTRGTTVLVVRGDDGVLRAFTNTCRHRHPLVVVERAGPGMVSTSAFTCPFAGWPEPHADPGSLRALTVAEAHGVVLVRPDGDGPIGVDAVVDAGTAHRLDDLGLEQFEYIGATRALEGRDPRAVVEELDSRPGTIVVADHAVVRQVEGGLDLTRVFALAESGDCVVDRRRYRLRA